MSTPFTVDMREFNRSIEEIAGFSGVETSRALDYEAGKILEAAIRNTPAAKVQKIVGNAGTGKALKADVGNGMKTYWMDNRYPDRIWNRLLKVRKDSLQRKLKARGLAKRSWWLLAVRAGLAVVVPSFVQRAIASTGKAYPENAEVRRVHVRGRWGLEFTNRQPTVQSPNVNGLRALGRAIQGRKKYFERNLRLGVFHDLRKIAKAYPGLIIKK